MALPFINPSAALLLQPEPLIPAAFAPFGTVITSALPSHLTTYPANIPPPLHPNHQPQIVPANQSTALKTSPISPLTNNYPSANTSSIHGQVQSATGLMSIFSSFPRQNTYITNDRSSGRQTLKLKLGILERHPYTTQTFCPFNYSEPHPAPPTQNSSKDDSQTQSVALTSPSTPSLSQDDKTYMLILVAPTTHDPKSTPPNPPDLTRLRAFTTPLNTSETPTMAITYAPGTWHAPMIVLGRRRVDFLVTQFANGVADNDCQEVLIGSGPDASTLTDGERSKRAEVGVDGNQVEVDVSFLLEGYEPPVEEERWTTDEAIRRTISASRAAKL